MDYITKIETILIRNNFRPNGNFTLISVSTVCLKNPREIVPHKGGRDSISLCDSKLTAYTISQCVVP